jgi:hypothetical protein
MRSGGTVSQVHYTCGFPIGFIQLFLLSLVRLDLVFTR